MGPQLCSWVSNGKIRINSFWDEELVHDSRLTMTWCTGRSIKKKDMVYGKIIKYTNHYGCAFVCRGRLSYHDLFGYLFKLFIPQTRVWLMTRRILDFYFSFINEFQGMLTLYTLLQALFISGFNFLFISVLISNSPELPL